MCFPYPTRQLAEDMAPASAGFYRTPFAVFDRSAVNGKTVTCACPLDRLECALGEILVIYEPRS